MQTRRCYLHVHTERCVGVARLRLLGPGSVFFPRHDWHRGECNCMSHRDLPRPLSERLALQNAWVMTAHLVAYHEQSTMPCETNGASTVNNRRWLRDRHSGRIWNHKHIHCVPPEASAAIKLDRARCSPAIGCCQSLSQLILLLLVPYGRMM